jgi:hypothetical protein
MFRTTALNATLLVLGLANSASAEILIGNLPGIDGIIGAVG